MTGPTRAERLATPPVREALRQVTADRGGCIRPVQLRRTDTTTGERTSVLVPCGSTLEAICPTCARRAKNLRATQCREGWHLADEPDLTPVPPDDSQAFWLTLRAEAQVRRDTAADASQDTAELDAVIEELDAELTAAGLRGTLTRTTGKDATCKDGQDRKVKRSRSTRRRQDAPKLPRRRVAARTTGKVYRARRQDLPALDVPDADLRQLRPGPRRWHPGQPGHLRLRPRGPRCGALPGPV